MATATGCAPAPDGRSSSPVVTRAASGSPPDRARSITSLKSSRDYSRVMRAGVRTKSGPITVVRLPSNEGPARVGIVVGRKLGGAVTRNRVKRRIRAAIREAGLAPDMDYVILPSAEAETMAFPDLVEAIGRASRQPTQERRQ